MTRACNIIIARVNGNTDDSLLGPPFLFLITAETKWTLTPAETLDPGTDFPQESVRAFPFSQRNYRFRDEIQFVVEFRSISLD